MKKHSCWICLLLALCVTFFTACEGEKQADVSSLTKPLPSSPSPTLDPRITDLNRIVAGTPAPDFELEDVDGKLVRLNDYRDKKAVILVFYRGHF